MFFQLLVYFLLIVSDVSLQSLPVKVKEQTKLKSRVIDYSNNYDEIWDEKPPSTTRSLTPTSLRQQENSNEQGQSFVLSSNVPSIKLPLETTVSPSYQKSNDGIFYDSRVEVPVAYEDIDFEENDPFEPSIFSRGNDTEEVSTDFFNQTLATVSREQYNKNESEHAPIQTELVSTQKNITVPRKSGEGRIKENIRKNTPVESNLSKIWNFIGGLFGSSEPSSQSDEKHHVGTDEIHSPNTTIVGFVTKDLSNQTVELYHSFHGGLLKHFCHSDRKLVEFQRSHGYQRQEPVGKVISTKRFDRKREQLLKRCPYLVEMKNLMSTKATQYLTVDIREAENIAKQKKWKLYASAGYCVTERGMCGATAELIVMWKRDHGKNDFDYIVDSGEEKKLLEKGFQRKSSLCFIWSL